jgi:hypothetical protein
MKLVLVLCATFLISCSSAPEKPAPRKSPPPRDESALFPAKDLVSTRVVADHAIDPSLAPGGTVGEYKKYRAFLLHLPAPDQAAFFLLDVKKALASPRYLPHMGGYFGALGGEPLYVFAKGPYVVALRGLSYEEADAAARISLRGYRLATVVSKIACPTKRN